MKQRSKSGRATLALGAFLLLAVVFGTTATADTSPTPTIASPTQVEYTSARLNGTINPNGGPSQTCWHFEIQTKADKEAGAESWQWASGYECLSEAESAESTPLAVHADAGGLQPNTKYVVRLVAGNEGGENTSAEAEFETKAVTPPTVTIDPVFEITGTSAHFSGTVNPNAPKDASELGGGSPEEEAIKNAYNTSWRFECEPGCGSPSGEPVGADNDPNAVDAVTGGLEPNTTYTVKLIAENAGGPNNEPAEATFKTAAVAPAPSSYYKAPVRELTATEATIQASVNPRNSAVTECRFEWGVDESYGNSVPCAEDPGSGGRPIPVAARLTGLQPATTYHFRVIVANAAGPAEGEDQHFVTLASAPDASATCPNEQFRTGLAQVLPECRAWEMVSPLDKNGADIAAEGNSHFSSLDGNAFAYFSRGTFADTIGSAGIGLSQYISRRSPEGWRTEATTPTPALNAFQLVIGSTVFFRFSDDLERVVGFAYDLPAASDDTPEVLNLYQLTTASGALRTISRSQVDPVGPIDFGEGALAVSADARHVAFSHTPRLLPGVPAGVPSTYEWEEGELRVAGILPNGEIPEEGSRLARNEVSPRFHNAMSPDGSRVAFVSPPFDGQLYLRRNHSNTVWVSEPEVSDSVEKPTNVNFEYTSPDSRHVLFLTDSQMVDEDDNSGTDLYLYSDGPDPELESNLTLISTSGNLGTKAVVGTSDDASVIYYWSQGELYRWADGDRRLIAPDLREMLDWTGHKPYVAYESPGASRVSADGNRLVLFTNSPGAEEKYGLTGQVTNGYPQFYVYDNASDMWTCASCPPSREGASGAATVVPHANNAVAEFSVARPRYLTRDGRFLFFSSPDALLPEDTNGVSDAYRYEIDTGQIALLSPGNRPNGAWFVEASPSGEDVFIATRDSLLERDTDKLVDIYDVRVDGGFAEPPSRQAPCSGDACHPPSPSPPPSKGTASEAFAGPGNAKCKHKRKRRCHKHNHKHSHKHKTHKHKHSKHGHHKHKHKHHNHRTTADHQGASR